VDDRDDLANQTLVDDSVDHPVFAAARSEEWGDRLAQRLADLSGRVIHSRGEVPDDVTSPSV
jgi:hypothetical protein